MSSVGLSSLSFPLRVASPPLEGRKSAPKLSANRRAPLSPRRLPTPPIVANPSPSAQKSRATCTLSLASVSASTFSSTSSVAGRDEDVENIATSMAVDLPPAISFPSSSPIPSSALLNPRSGLPPAPHVLLRSNPNQATLRVRIAPAALLSHSYSHPGRRSVRRKRSGKCLEPESSSCSSAAALVQFPSSPASSTGAQMCAFPSSSSTSPPPPYSLLDGGDSSSSIPPRKRARSSSFSVPSTSTSLLLPHTSLTSSAPASTWKSSSQRRKAAQAEIKLQTTVWRCVSALVAKCDPVDSDPFYDDIDMDVDDDEPRSSDLHAQDRKLSQQLRVYLLSRGVRQSELDHHDEDDYSDPFEFFSSSSEVEIDKENQPPSQADNINTRLPLSDLRSPILRQMSPLEYSGSISASFSRAKPRSSTTPSHLSISQVHALILMKRAKPRVRYRQDSARRSPLGMYEPWGVNETL